MSQSLVLASLSKHLVGNDTSDWLKNDEHEKLHTSDWLKNDKHEKLRASDRLETSDLFINYNCKVLTRMEIANFFMIV